MSLDPLGPIIVRSGRPSLNQTDGDPARFPPPSTLAGCLRTAWARATNRSFGPHLSELSVNGPLLLTRDERTLVPKPADARYFGHGRGARCVPAAPRRLVAGSGMDLPDGLMPVELTERVEGKPVDGPEWWSWDDLLHFRDRGTITYGRLVENGWTPRADRRTHVVIDPATRTAANGQLFQTEGLDLDAAPGARGAAAGGLRLLARCQQPLGEALVHLGGKRRLAALAPEPESVWPVPPDDWAVRIAKAGGLSITLLTPAVFTAGYRPGWLDDELVGSPPAAPGLRMRLVAVMVDRPQVHSGWDLAARKPRPSRKLAGAGATYWLQLLGDADASSLDRLWLTSISDLEQDRRDGFGLALPSPWSPPD